MTISNDDVMGGFNPTIKDKDFGSWLNFKTWSVGGRHTLKSEESTLLLHEYLLQLTESEVTTDSVRRIIVAMFGKESPDGIPLTSREIHWPVLVPIFKKIRRDVLPIVKIEAAQG